jgi:hypothetical protein
MLLAALSAAGSTTMALGQPAIATITDAPEKDTGRPNSVIGKNDKTLLAAVQTSEANVAYALPNACLIAVLRPAQILKSPVAELMPTEVMQAAAVKELGLDPMNAEQIVASVAPPVGGPPSYSVLLKFSQPASLKSGEITEHTENAEVRGKSYLRSKELLLPSFYSIDDKSILAAPDFSLMQLVNREGRPEISPLAADLAAADKGDDLLVLLDLEPLRPLINMAIAQSQLPPELGSLQEIPSLLKRVQLRFNLTQPQPTELIAIANSEQDAMRIVEIFNEMKKLLAQKMVEESNKALASDDPVEQASGRYSQRMAKYWYGKLQLNREGDRLILLREEGGVDPSKQFTYVATIGVLVALLLPAVQAAREAARRAQSMNNIKQIMLGLNNHESARGAFPANAIYDNHGKPLLSWRVRILPYMEQQALYKQFHLDEPWDSEHNKKLIPLMPEVFAEPSSGFTVAEGRSSYLGVVGEECFFSGAQDGRKFEDLTDGSSKTIAIVQVDNAAAVPWTKPDDWKPDDNNLMKPFEGPHPGGFLAGFADCHARFISSMIDPKVFKSLLTIAGGEDVDVDQ